MCLIAFSYRSHPKFPLIFAANRDEFYERPTRPAQFWNEHTDLLAGKDLRAGGTWLGINREGEFAALTNFRNPDINKENPPSRGEIVLNYLASDLEIDRYLKMLDEKADRYNGFNVLGGTIDELRFYSNQEKEIKELDAGVYGLSNYLLNTPWPKVERAKEGLDEIISQDNTSVDEEALFELLKNDARAPDDRLPDTGIPKDLERAVSPIFINTEQYGTRSSTILLIDLNKNVIFEERRYEPGSQRVKEKNRYEFTLRNTIGSRSA